MGGTRIFRMIAGLAGFVFVTLTGGEARAQNSDEWEFSASLYAWLPIDVDGRTVFNRGRISERIEIPIDTVVDDLEFVFQGDFMVRRGRWGFLADVVTVDLADTRSASRAGTIGSIAVPAEVSGDFRLAVDSWLVTATGFFRLHDDEGSNLDFVFGARLVDLAQRLSWRLEGDIAGIPLLTRQGELRASETYLDAVVGLKGRFGWSRESRWFTPFYLDIGTGDSDLTWQGVVGVGRTFDWGEIKLTYRYLDYDFASDDLFQSLGLSGPALGATWRF